MAFDERAAAHYLEGPRRQVPGHDGVLRMSALLLAERVPADGRVLVLGAGGGLELRSFADAQPGWRFDGVDPSGPMLRLAETTVGPHGHRVGLHEGRIEVAPDGPFDGATCLLTFHFIGREERLETLRQLHRRLKPGAPLVVVHHSFATAESARWIGRHVAFGSAAAPSAQQVEQAQAAMAERLTILHPSEDEAMLRQAGFSDVTMFFMALSFRGWVVYA